MRISVVCSDPGHPVYPLLEQWCAVHRASHDVELLTRVAELGGGDILFLISCSQIVSAEVRERYAHCLVIHASDLPGGRGWSPLVWQIVEGKDRIAVTLLEAADSVDSGPVWAKRWLNFDGTELVDEINAALFAVELELMDYAVANVGQVQPQLQDATAASWYPRRRPEDSRIDPQRSLAEQFDLLRVADPQRYPAFFDFRGQRYEISIRKRNRDD